MGNLFAYRSTDPRKLHGVKDAIGPRNDRALLELQDDARLVVCAWSDAGGYLARDKAVLRFLRDPHCLVKLASGRPGHPLYKPADLTPIRL